MKTFILLTLFGAGALLFTACQNHSEKPDLTAKEHRTYNPQTGTFEQSPPWGKQSNKSDTQ